MWKGSCINLGNFVCFTLTLLGFSVFLTFFPSHKADSWGLETHKIVNELACDTLPPSSLRTFFSIHKKYISEHAVDPDVVFRKRYGKEEGVKHFINLDSYGLFPFGELPRDYAQAVKKFGRTKIQREGILPWWIMGSQRRLQRAMKQGDWEIVRLKASHLGHYVADLFMPLHTTANYDGQITGNDGIHKRVEDGLVDARIERYRLEMRGQLKKADLETMGIKDVFDYSLKSYLLAKKILESDREASKGLSRFSNMSWLYYQRLERKTKPIIIKQLVDACQLLGNMWYSAWIQAGKPNPPLSD